jgi:hypothetical protein
LTCSVNASCTAQLASVGRSEQAVPGSPNPRESPIPDVTQALEPWLVDELQVQPFGDLSPSHLPDAVTTRIVMPFVET